MSPLRLLVLLQYAAIFLCWPTLACAAELTFDAALGQITFRAGLVLFTVSTIGGLAALLTRLSNEANQAQQAGRRFEIQPLPLALLIAAQMTSAWTAGFVFYSGSAKLGFGGLEIGFIVPLASFFSAKALEWASGITFVNRGAP